MIGIHLVMLFISLAHGQGNSEDDADSEKYVNMEEVKKMQSFLKERMGDEYGVDWIYMPDGDGHPVVANLTQDMAFSRANNAEKSYNISQSIVYSLYTRSTAKKGKQVSVERRSSFKSAKFDPKKLTKVIIHGWMSSGDSATVQNIKDAYLKRSDMNVIGVDWSRISSSYNYLTPAGEVPKIGNHVAKMIDTLVSSQSARYKDFHIVGHSLGAHVAGIAGKRTAKKISRVTGLDPALPGFEFWQYSGDKLDKSSADFVDVIHSCAGILGMWGIVGHADFYPNGGTPSQPGCCCDEETAVCSHARSHLYFAESIASGVHFVAVPCDDFDSFQNGNCDSKIAIMGDPATSDNQGVYYLMTNTSSPFALGPAGAKYNHE